MDKNRERRGTAVQLHATSQGEKRSLTLREKPAVVRAQHNQP